ncbi:NAD-dependent epimerase/dehydratase family protein [Chitinimonas naiadis]
MNIEQIALALAGKSVLVTGGAGFIGCALARRLAPHAGRYVVMDNLHPQVHARAERPAALHERAELIVADVTLPASWDQVLAAFRPDIIVHLAAETGTGQSLTEASRHGMVNVVGTTQLTDALGRHQIRPEQILLTSSRAVYGEGAWVGADGVVSYPGARGRVQLEAGQWDFPGMVSQAAVAGQTQPQPTSVYAATKLTQEHILSAWCLAQKVPLSILRLQNVYGPGQSLTNSYTGIVALFSRMAKAQSVIPLYEDGEVTRDFVYIDDVADALAAAVSKPATPARLLDIGSGVATTIRQMASEVAAYYGAPNPTVSGQFRDGDVRHAACAISAAQAELGWAPQWSLSAGVAALQVHIADQL